MFRLIKIVCLLGLISCIPYLWDKGETFSKQVGPSIAQLMHNPTQIPQIIGGLIRSFTK